VRPSASVIGLAAVACLFAFPSAAQSPLDPPDAIVLSEAQAIVQRMIENPRGPYSRIRWFCNDGSVLPPEPFACREHGGGRQHAEYSSERARLAELGWNVGTIFAAMSFAEIADDGDRRSRLREMPLETYMVDVDDGWVLRQARSYRGRVQIEGEEATGQALLLELLQDREFTAENFLLVREVVRVVPHGGAADDLARDVRRTAIEIADLDPSFQPLRAEIHGSPNAATSGRVRAWAARVEGEIAAEAERLAGLLDQLYGSAGRRERLAAHQLRFARFRATQALAAALDLDTGSPPALRLGGLAALARDTRTLATAAATSAAARLETIDFLTDLEGEIFITAGEALTGNDLSRRALLDIAVDLIDASFGTGLLSAREHAALLDAARVDAEAEHLEAERFAAMVETLRRAPQWAAGNVRYTFAEPLVRYSALDARAAQFTDDVLRGSALVGLGDVTRRLAGDLASLTGVSQLINGRGGLSAFGLNPGVAQDSGRRQYPRRPFARARCHRGRPRDDSRFDARRRHHHAW
jgi:hypothetical protein